MSCSPKYEFLNISPLQQFTPIDHRHSWSFYCVFTRQGSIAEHAIKTECEKKTECGTESSKLMTTTGCEVNVECVQRKDFSVLLLIDYGSFISKII